MQCLELSRAGLLYGPRFESGTSIRCRTCGTMCAPLEIVSTVPILAKAIENEIGNIIGGNTAAIRDEAETYSFVALYEAADRTDGVGTAERCGFLRGTFARALGVGR